MAATRYSQLPADERFWSKVDATGDCWLWTGYRNWAGYGIFTWPAPTGAKVGKHELAHRVAWKLMVSEIPKPLEIDHLCRNRLCVNPDHLEVVTARENSLRSNSPSGRHARKTHCLKGHPYSGENLIGTERHRVCRTCKREWNRVQARRHREKVLGDTPIG